MLSIEVWDTGIGIAQSKVQSIFEEYNQIDNPVDQVGRSRGLGLSIVKRLGDLLDHRISVQSRLNKWSVFSIEVMLAPGEAKLHEHYRQVRDEWTIEGIHRAIGMAQRGIRSYRKSNIASASSYGNGSGWASKQEYRYRSRY